MKLKRTFLLLIMLISLHGFGQQNTPLEENFDASASLPENWTVEISTYGWLVKPWGYTEPNALAVPFHGTENKNDWVFTPK